MAGRVQVFYSCRLTDTKTEQHNNKVVKQFRKETQQVMKHALIKSSDGHFLVLSRFSFFLNNIKPELGPNCDGSPKYLDGENGPILCCASRRLRVDIPRIIRFSKKSVRKKRHLFSQSKPGRLLSVGGRYAGRVHF